ncbi:hypothetical protein F5050DRAFT_1709527 [Lentinula boryana]|uniref:Uncharacterized protein n=1 Tax=Lentinula boryana TaxID=40481 RepID=A0ABQ8QMP0_9AGAR|nr:hypothetical protein F5050DRAFT_1709527 [Lentinula boryana]
MLHRMMLSVMNRLGLGMLRMMNLKEKAKGMGHYDEPANEMMKEPEFEEPEYAEAERDDMRYWTDTEAYKTVVAADTSMLDVEEEQWVDDASGYGEKVELVYEVWTAVQPKLDSFDDKDLEIWRKTSHGLQTMEEYVAVASDEWKLESALAVQDATSVPTTENVLENVGDWRTRGPLGGGGRDISSHGDSHTTNQKSDEIEWVTVHWLQKTAAMIEEG